MDYTMIIIHFCFFSLFMFICISFINYFTEKAIKYVSSKKRNNKNEVTNNNTIIIILSIFIGFIITFLTDILPIIL